MKRATTRVPANVLVVGAVVAVVVLAGAAARARAAAGDLLAYGTDEQFWHAEVVRTADPTVPGERTVIRTRGRGDGAAWRPVAEVGARAVGLATRGAELVVLLPDGQWVLVSQPDVYGTAGVRSGVPLPDGARAVAVAGAGDVLWAIGATPVTASGASTIPTRPTTIAATTRSATAPASPERLSLYRLDGGGWALVRPDVGATPGRADPSALSLVVVDGHPWLAIHLGGDGTIGVQQLSADGAVDRGRLTPAFAVAAFELLVSGGRPVLWAAADAGAGVLFARDQDGGAWVDPVELRPTNEIPPGADRAAATALRRLRLLTLSGDRKLVEQAFDPADGAPLGEATQLTLARPAPPIDPRIHDVLQLLVLLLLTFVLFGTFRRRQALQDALRHQSRARLAPLGVRLAAGAVDAVPVVVAYALVIVPAEDATELQARALDPMLWLWRGALVCVYLLHTTVSEVLTGRTLGKRLLGLRVTSLDGSTAPPRGAMVSRNLLRIVDVILPLLLLMVAFSPLRQRLGDLAAGTLVVRDGKTGDDDDDDDDDEPVEAEEA